MRLVVRLEDREKLQRLLALNTDLGSISGVRRRGRRNLEKVQERVQRVGVVSREWAEGVRSVEEDDGVSVLQEVFSRGRTTRSGTEVVEEAHSVALERDGRAAGLGSALCELQWR